jgi:ligand-binding sensor domain-containing protein
MKYIFTVISIFIYLNSFADKTTVVSIKDGLSSNNIKDIKIDSKHFLWLSTNNGLNRYDGVHNYIFERNIINGNIFSIELIDSMLFVSNNNKLFKINTNNYKYDSIYLPSKHKKIINLFKLSNKNLIAYSENGGLIFFDENFKIKNIIQFKKTNSISIAEYDNFLFISQPFSGTNGIVRIDLKKINSPNSKLNELVYYYRGNGTYRHNQIVNLKNVGLLFISEKGVKYYDKTKNIFIHYKDLNKEITNIYPFNNESFFIIKNNFLSQEYNFKKHKYLNILYDNIDNIEISKIVVDYNNIFLTSNDGLIIINRPDVKSMHLKQSTYEKIENKLIVRRSIVENNGTKYFFNYESIYKLKENNLEYNIINTSPLITYSALIINNNAYIGTEGNGLCKLDLITEKTCNLVPFKKFPDSSLISYIFKLNSNSILLGTNRGLYKYDIYKNELSGKIKFKGDNYSQIKHIIKSSNGEYWISSTHGIHIFDKNLKYTRSINKETTINKICSDSINFVYQMNDSIYWLGTYNGIQQYNSKLKKFSKHYNIENGLSNNIIVSINRDNSNRLWINTFNGINIFDLNNNYIYRLSKYDGLKNNEYNFNSYLLSSDSILYLGGINGYEALAVNDIFVNKNKYKEIQISEIINVNTLKNEQNVSQYTGVK